MSVVLCLPAHLCVSTAASRGQAPQGNASLRVCSVLGHLAPVHRCARSVRCGASTVSWATWLLFTGVPAWFVVLRLRCPGSLGSCSPVRPLDVLCCVWGVLGHLAPVHRCARWVCCVACAVSWATWLPFTDVPAGCVVLCVRCPGPRGSCSLVCSLSVLLCVCGVLGHLAPVHLCARSVCCVACVVSWVTCLLFTGVPAWFVMLRLRCPGPLGSCSPVRLLGVLCCVCGVPGHLAPVHRCARSLRRFARAVSWATWLLFTGVPAPSFVLLVRCPGPLGSCSPVCPFGVLLCVCGVLGHLAPLHRCARPCCPVPLLPSVHVRVRCPGPRGACSLVCALCVVRMCRWWLCPSSSPPNFLFCFCFFFFLGPGFSFFSFGKEGTRIHCRHRHGQLVQRCNSVVFSGVCRRCFGGGRSPGVRLARPDVHGYGLVASLLLVVAG